MSARQHSRRGLTLLLIAGAVSIGACGSSTPPCTVTSVALSPTASTLFPGSSTTLTANAVSENCSPMPATTWASASQTIAIVNTSGQVTGVATGVTTITATIGGVTGTAVVTVGAAPVNTVEVTPSTGSVAVGQTLTLAAVTKDPTGNALTGRAIAWTSSATNIATVNVTTGVVAGVAVGSATITATSEGKTASATITVTQAPVNTVTVQLPSATMVVGATQTALAVLRDAANNILTGRVVAWTSSNTAVASINATTGLITAATGGSTVITATSEGKANTATLIVSQVPVNTVTISVTSTTMAPATTQQATVVLKDAAGVTLTGRTVTWTSSANSVASVTAGSGLITAFASGTAAITATSEGKSDVVVITVIQPAPTLVSVAPATIDAVFATVPITLVGTNFVVGSTTLAFTGNNITAATPTVASATSITTTINIAGGLLSTTSNITATTPGGTTLPIQLTLYSVGLAPVVTGTAVGGTGGSAFTTMDCPAGQVATGLNARSSEQVDQIGIRCQPVTGTTRTFGAVTSTTTAGGSSGTAVTLACPANSVMTGVSGRSSGWMDQLAAICSPIAGGATTTTAVAGTNGTTTAFTSSCPAGLVVTGIQGKAGAYIDQIQLRCR